MPGGTVGVQAVPPFRAPAFGDPVPLQDQVRQAAPAQFLAHCQPGLTAAYDQRLDFLD
jgi:hypothetical protein